MRNFLDLKSHGPSKFNPALLCKNSRFWQPLAVRQPPFLRRAAKHYCGWIARSSGIV